MRLLAYLLVMLLSHTAVGQIFDPPPLDPNPLIDGAGSTPGTGSAATPESKDSATASEGQQASILAQPGQRFKTPLVAREKTRVAILGYHNFSETKTVTRMLMRTSELRAQMERIRQSDFSVISMQEFLEWRFGTRLLPERCILITLDDGWRSVYTDAYPIFKEYGYPFHLFLYTSYLSGCGDSMTPDMVREMQQHGGSVGCHSATHPLPNQWKGAERKGIEAYESMIDREIGDTRKVLESQFGLINTYCYPGGYNDATMQKKLQEHNYAAAFTVIPGKVESKENPLTLARYMILGTDPGVFDNAMDFTAAEIAEGPSTGYTPGALPRNTPKPTFPVSPQADASVAPNMLIISANLSSMPHINLKDVRMQVSGFGYVPHKINHAERTVQWTAPCRIYMPLISVHISWKNTDGKTQRAAWSFFVDRTVTAD